MSRVQTSNPPDSKHPGVRSPNVEILSAQNPSVQCPSVQSPRVLASRHLEAKRLVFQSPSVQSLWIQASKVKASRSCIQSPAQWVSDVCWTSNGRLYEVWTSYWRPLPVQRTSDAHWAAFPVCLLINMWLWFFLIFWLTTSVVYLSALYGETTLMNSV